MKKLIVIILILVSGGMVSPTTSRACEFYFQVDNEKENYQEGDEVIITVTLELTHRRCDVKPEETIFSSEGLEITGATQWVQISAGVYARKFKAKITGTSKISTFLAKRECTKDGAQGSIKFTKS